ncbi:MAG: carbohydrate-binding protein, partial [Planctomycetota bacterium]
YENMLVGGHVITHNTMRNAGRHFFNFYGNGTSTASRNRSAMDYMATLFAHNHVYNGMLQTRDAGLITGYYSSGGTLNELNSQVVYNVLHDSYDTAAMRWGLLGIIYLDAGTCDVDLHHNLLWAAPGSLQRGLWYNTACVDIREHDNVFHPGFTRTCAELTPADFSQGAPFRFGHDFDDRPPLPQWPPLVTQPLAVNPAASVDELCDGDCLAFDAVNFNDGWQSAVLRFASDAKQMNSDKSARARPRHRAATDPLVLEATHNDGLQETIRTQWTFLYNVGGDSWVRFNQVPLGSGYRRFRVIYGVDSTQPRGVEVHLDSAEGPLVGQVDLPRTDRPRKGRIQLYGEAIGQLSAEATGTRDVFFVFRSEDGQPVGEFEYFRFEQYRGQIALQTNEVKLELRVGSKDGPKIGEFYPRFTGGSDSYRQFVAPLEPGLGTRPLFLVVRSALSGPIGTLDGLEFRKAAAPASPNGVGLPPRLDSRGRMILPQPTHRPCAQPADKYYEQQLARRGPRPLFLATRLQTPPTLDGRLDEWLDKARVMNLRESFDGSETTAAPSTAWVGYDDRAMYVAAKHPVNDVAALHNRTHQSAPTDYMEVALRDPSATESSVLTLRGYPDGHFAGAEPGLEQTVSYRAGLEADAWVCEWRIPFAACGFTPREAPHLAFNLAVRHGEQDTWAVWRGTGGAPAEVSRAGTLLYPSEYAAVSHPPQDALAVWLDAADATTIERDDEGKVALWKDKSEKRNDARQSDPNHRPQYVANVLNGKPALRFSETVATRLELADLSDGKISATIFVVFSNPTPASEVNHNPRLFTASDGQGYDYQVGLCASVPGLETGGPRQMIARFQDGWAKKVRVGCFSPTYQTYFTGHIAEILVYTRTLAPEEQQQVRAYLMSKWDL